MTFKTRRIAQLAIAASLFIAGVLVGSLRTTATTAAQNRFGQPKTVLHFVIYKFRDAASEYDKEQAFNGLREIARKTPGIKNIWLKTERNQMKDFSGIYAIEFTTPDAAADYAESPLHDTWSKQWQNIRETSVSFQVSNP